MPAPPHRALRSPLPLLLAIALCRIAAAQTPSSAAPPGATLDPLHKGPVLISPLTQPTINPGALLLMELEGRFAQAVAAGGGSAFATWFADDALTLNNGRPPVRGRAAIAADATWDPKMYQLTWVPEGAEMGPSNDMGYTWGHYEGRSKDKAGQPIVQTGRYITIWKKTRDGSWKVAMDASANEPPHSGDCCTLPKP